MAPTTGLDLDWSKLSRWCLRGAIVMSLWLLYPTARCSFATFSRHVDQRRRPGLRDEGGRSQASTGTYAATATQQPGAYAMRLVSFKGAQ